MNRAFYNFAFYLLLPIIVLRLLWRALVLPAPAYARRWGERLGFVEHAREQRTESRWIWIHAASVGESVAISPLVLKLRREQPDWGIVVTTMTPTGSERIAELFGDDVCHVYAPYDYAGAVKRFLNAFHPALVILVETELWPNLVHYSKKSGARIMVANARLSDKSFRGYQKFSALGKPMLQKLDCIAAQSASDAERFERLGVSRQVLHVTGSMKFDVSLPEQLGAAVQAMAMRVEDNRPVWIAASTREGEEEKVLAALKLIKRELPTSLLILVPRHPERFTPVERLCEKQSWRVVRRSSGHNVDALTDILLGDSMGELLAYYGVAQVAFVGGSLVDTGCQNVLEPAALGMPVLVGPSQFNFQTICEQLQEVGALRTVRDEQGLAQEVVRLLQDDTERTAMGDRARNAVAANKGALGRIYDLTAQYLPD